MQKKNQPRQVAQKLEQLKNEKGVPEGGLVSNRGGPQGRGGGGECQQVSRQSAGAGGKQHKHQSEKNARCTDIAYHADNHANRRQQTIRM
jgi:hypothetical protein